MPEMKAAQRASRQTILAGGVWQFDVVKKITVYLPDDLEAALKRVAADRGESRSQIVREAVGERVRRVERPRPRLPLFRSGDPTLAERFDEGLAGFGES